MEMKRTIEQINKAIGGGGETDAEIVSEDPAVSAVVELDHAGPELIPQDNMSETATNNGYSAHVETAYDDGPTDEDIDAAYKRNEEYNAVVAAITDKIDSGQTEESEGGGEDNGATLDNIHPVI